MHYLLAFSKKGNHKKSQKIAFTSSAVVHNCEHSLGSATSFASTSSTRRRSNVGCTLSAPAGHAGLKDDKFNKYAL